MKIAIDGLLLFPPFTGLQKTLVHHVDAVAAVPGHGVLLFTPKDAPADLGFSDNVSVIRTGFAGSKRLRRIIYRNFFLQRRCYRESAEILHAHAYYLPPAVSLPSVVTVHDVIAATHPNLVSKGSRNIFKRALPKTLVRATRVITPTAFVKEQLVSLYDAPPEKIDVIPWYTAPAASSKISENAGKDLRHRMNLPERYILFVGRLEKKKNLPFLIKAFWTMQMLEKLPHKLIICGPPGNDTAEIERTIRTHRAEPFVAFTGYLPERLLPDVYRLADAVVLPSLAEGFGLPLIEAMAAGVPVLCSDIPPLREVAADAAAYAPPNDLKRWREMLGAACSRDRSLRNRIDAGLERCREFSREAYTAAVIETYDNILAGE